MARADVRGQRRFLMCRLADLDEGKRGVDQHVHAELDGEKYGEEIFKDVEQRIVGRIGGVPQLGLHDIGQEAEENAEGYEGLDVDAVVRPSQPVSSLLQEAGARLPEEDGLV